MHNDTCVNGNGNDLWQLLEITALSNGWIGTSLFCMYPALLRQIQNTMDENDSPFGTGYNCEVLLQDSAHHFIRV